MAHLRFFDSVEGIDFVQLPILAASILCTLGTCLIMAYQSEEERCLVRLKGGLGLGEAAILHRGMGFRLAVG